MRYVCIVKNYYRGILWKPGDKLDTEKLGMSPDEKPPKHFAPEGSKIIRDNMKSLPRLGAIVPRSARMKAAESFKDLTERMAVQTPGGETFMVDPPNLADAANGTPPGADHGGGLSASAPGPAAPKSDEVKDWDKPAEGKKGK